jgi:putative glutamine amidotransferase
MIPAVDRDSVVKRSDLSLHGYAEALDGLVLQGGNDMQPAGLWRGRRSRRQWQGDAVRDRYEVELLQRFMHAGKPVLGICRGCQLINVAFGGTLYQDIPTQQPRGAVPCRRRALRATAAPGGAGARQHGAVHALPRAAARR